MSDVNQQISNEEPQVQPSSLEQLFSERDTKNKKDLVENKETTEKVESKKEELIKKDSVQKQNNSPEEPTQKENEKKSLKKEPEKNDDDEEEDIREIEIKKLKKALNDSQKWGHSNNKKLKSATKALAAMKEDGILEEEAFNNLNSLLLTEAVDDEQQELSESDNPLVNLIRIADKRIPDLEEIYEEDESFKKKIASFNFFIQHASEQELEEVMEELEDLKGNPLKLAKKMYQIGEKFYQDVYKDLDSVGGFKKFVEFKNLEIEKLQKKIDKLEKKLLQSNDYDKPTFRIDELTNTENSTTTHRPNDSIGQLFEQREASYKKAKSY